MYVHMRLCSVCVRARVVHVHVHVCADNSSASAIASGCDLSFSHAHSHSVLVMSVPVSLLCDSSATGNTHSPRLLLTAIYQPSQLTFISSEATQCFQELLLCFLSPPLPPCRWYHGTIGRHHAEEILSRMPDFSFLVRKSETSLTSYSLSLK